MLNVQSASGAFSRLNTWGILVTAEGVKPDPAKIDVDQTLAHTYLMCVNVSLSLAWLTIIASTFHNLPN